MDARDIIYVYSNDADNTYTIGWEKDIRNIRIINDNSRIVYLVECKKADLICEFIGKKLAGFGITSYVNEHNFNVSSISFDMIVEIIDRVIQDHFKVIALLNKAKDIMSSSKSVNLNE